MQDSQARWIEEFNAGIIQLAITLAATHSDFTIFVFDTFALFNAVMQKPQQFAETARFQDTRNFCATYAAQVAALDPSSTSAIGGQCRYSPDEYLWLNTLHPTVAMHRLLSIEIQRLLQWAS